MSAYETQRIPQPEYGTKLSTATTSQGDDGPDNDKTILTEAAEGVPFFTPKQWPPAGTAIKPKDGAALPKLFTPLKIRDMVMQNRIWVSPMCQYSAHDGFHTPWHITHLGGMIQRGPGLVMIEATSVSANGRITPEDSGIYLDAHVATLRKHVEFAHSQSARIAIQLAHAGRKASTVAPWLSHGATATRKAHGWPDDVVGPSEEPFAAGYPTPRSMTLAEIDQVKRDFVAGARRAIEAGFDVIELHFAHGYLVSSFLTPAVNKRTDKYGGSFENRARLALELVDEVRAVMPASMPLFARISATDWLEESSEHQGAEGSWTVEQSAKLAALLAERGVDVLDVSSGGNHSAQKVKAAPGFQAPLAKHIKRAVGDKLLVSSVGMISQGTLAEEIISGGKSDDDVGLDLIAAGRPFQKNPGLVWSWAEELGIEVQQAHQISWGFAGRSSHKNEYVDLDI